MLDAASSEFSRMCSIPLSPQANKSTAASEMNVFELVMFADDYCIRSLLYNILRVVTEPNEMTKSLKLQPLLYDACITVT